MSNNQTKNQAATGMSIDTKEFRDLLHAVWRANSVSIAEERTNNLIAHIDAHTADLRAQLARQGQGETIKVLQAALAAALDHDGAAASAQSALEREWNQLMDALGCEDTESALKKIAELGAQPDRGACVGCGGKPSGDNIPCVVCGAAPHSQPVRGVPDHDQALKLAEQAGFQNLGGFIMPPRTNGHITTEVVKLVQLAAAPSPAAQPVAPPAPTYWNSQQKMISRAIIGLRDGWATRKDADDALAALEVAASVSPQGSQVGGQSVVCVPVDAYLWLMGMGRDGFVEDRPGAFWWRSAFNERAGLDMMDVYQASKRQPQSTATEGANQKGDS